MNSTILLADDDASLRFVLSQALSKEGFQVRATSNGGETQPAEPRWNPAGYLRNVIETVRVTAG